MTAEFDRLPVARSIGGEEAESGREQMGGYHLFNLIGFLVETTLAAAHMIFSGALDKYPDLRLCLSHPGGMALWIQGRFAHGLRTLPARESSNTRRASILR